MTPVRAEEAIFRTVLYADLFDYPLTQAEIQHYLIREALPPETVNVILETSPWLAARVICVNGYFALRDRAHIGPLRDERRQAAEALWPRARRWGYLVGCLPYVRMVAVTGALAVDNVSPEDDIDFMIVTEPGRVWLARGFSVLLVRLARLSGVELCPNYLLSTSALEQEERTLFAAHDLAQMVPLVGHEIYARMRALNEWADEFLPHAALPLRVEPDLAPRGISKQLQRVGEFLLSGGVGDWLEKWERERKMRKFAVAAQQPGSAARLDADRVKGHFRDYGEPLLRMYEERAARYFQ